VTAAVTVAQSGAPGVSLGFKNRIINGNFGIWQRGTSVTPPLGSLSSYVSDRWASYQTGAATAVTKQNGFNGQPNCAAFNGTASNTEVTLFQCIESLNCSDLVGSTITLSVWLYSTVASKSVSLYIDTANTVDTFSSVTQRASLVVSVPSGAWTQYTLTYSNADSSVANGIRIRANFGACTSGTFAITGVQLEKGTAATQFDYRPYGTELALCQRYYETTATNGTIGLNETQVQIVWNAAYCTASQFKVTKRAAPTVTIYSRGNTAGQVSSTASGANVSAATATNISTSGVWSIYLTTGQTAYSSGMEAGFTASAEL
jgi:hypothetical protein